ncbi:MAG: hypothetical protein AAB608_00795 [Patescibacteria group bacterium]
MKPLGILFVVLFGVIVGVWLWPESHDNVQTPSISATPSPEALSSVSPAPSSSPSSAPSSSPTATLKPSVSSTPQNYVITIRADGVAPKELTIRPGDSVTFKNEGLEGAWPASDPHPSHTLCPFFDADKRMAIGETYTVTFPEVKTCSFHNHTNPSSAFRGTIRVQ